MKLSVSSPELCSHADDATWKGITTNLFARLSHKPVKYSV